VRDGVHAWAWAPLTLALLWVTQLGSGWCVVPFTAAGALLLGRAGRRRAGVLLVVAAAGGEVLEIVLKLSFHRPRPIPFFGLSAPFTWSFPSGHAIAACTLYGTLAWLLSARAPGPRQRLALWLAAAAMVASIGFSRVYLGFHYPTDVLAGYAVGVAWLAGLRARYPQT
jgi:undecaprenyl-diphosphatase